ncbi:cysteine peptidase family C39 domain-containing protein, partial [Bacillus thuringiensis]|uniref:cysteine peptidase family C39 domain-containing protein n=1 Tax=Bacillus thuringiensis TaxID=1428 RepID=UPI0021B265D5
ISITKLTHLLPTHIKPTTLNPLQSPPKRLPFHTKPVTVNPETFMTKFSLPPIPHIITKQPLPHFLLLHKITNHTLLFLHPPQQKTLDKLH